MLANDQLSHAGQEDVIREREAAGANPGWLRRFIRLTALHPQFSLLSTNR
jgi:hypothetical protein